MYPFLIFISCIGYGSKVSIIFSFFHFLSVYDPCVKYISLACQFILDELMRLLLAFIFIFFFLIQEWDLMSNQGTNDVMRYECMLRATVALRDFGVCGQIWLNPEG
jgi:hypothetical protein